MLPANEKIIVDGTDVTTEFWGILAEDHKSELERAEDEQIKLMQAEKRVSGGERKDLPYGRLKFKICQEVYHFWGRKLRTYECWTDKEFLKWIEKRFGDLVAVKSRSDRIVV